MNATNMSDAVKFEKVNIKDFLKTKNENIALIDYVMVDENNKVYTVVNPDWVVEVKEGEHVFFNFWKHLSDWLPCANERIEYHEIVEALRLAQTQFVS